MGVGVDCEPRFGLDVLLGEIDVVVVRTVDDLDIDPLRGGWVGGGEGDDVGGYDDEGIGEGVVPDAFDVAVWVGGEVEFDSKGERGEEREEEEREQGARWW